MLARPVAHFARQYVTLRHATNDPSLPSALNLSYSRGDSDLSRPYGWRKKGRPTGAEEKKKGAHAGRKQFQARPHCE